MSPYQDSTPAVVYPFAYTRRSSLIRKSRTFLLSRDGSGCREQDSRGGDSGGTGEPETEDYTGHRPVSPDTDRESTCGVGEGMDEDGRQGVGQTRWNWCHPKGLR